MSNINSDISYPEHHWELPKSLYVNNSQANMSIFVNQWWISDLREDKISLSSHLYYPKFKSKSQLFLIFFLLFGTILISIIYLFMLYVLSLNFSEAFPSGLAILIIFPVIFLLYLLLYLQIASYRFSKAFKPVLEITSFENPEKSKLIWYKKGKQYKTISFYQVRPLMVKFTNNSRPVIGKMKLSYGLLLLLDENEFLVFPSIAKELLPDAYNALVIFLTKNKTDDIPWPITLKIPEKPPSIKQAKEQRIKIKNYRIWKGITCLYLFSDYVKISLTNEPYRTKWIFEKAKTSKWIYVAFFSLSFILFLATVVPFAIGISVLANTSQIPGDQVSQLIYFGLGILMLGMSFIFLILSILTVYFIVMLSLAIHSEKSLEIDIGDQTIVIREKIPLKRRKEIKFNHQTIDIKLEKQLVLGLYKKYVFYTVYASDGVMGINLCSSQVLEEAIKYKEELYAKIDHLLLRKSRPHKFLVQNNF